jgi:putative DNA methylase
LSDFFYVWMHRSLYGIYPDLLSTLLVPKQQELIATPYRFDGDSNAAKKFFELGLKKTFRQLRMSQNKSYPLTIYYAFRQAEGSTEGIASTGWETILEALASTGYQVTGTWPMRTERTGGLRDYNQNALASSIVLVCRMRHEEADIITRRDFLSTLKRELPDALRNLQQGNIAPVDLAQASIGPGMAIFSRYSKVVEADGSPMSVRTALALINQALDEYLTEQESDYDADTRWALAWYEQHGFDEGVYGDAETLSRAKVTSVQGMVEAGFLYARAGRVRLLRRQELDLDWNPARDKRLTVWELTQQLIHALESRGVDGAAVLLSAVGPLGEVARELAYRLYTLCERKGWAQEALAYNGLVVSWNDISKQAAEIAAASPVQGTLGFGTSRR